MTIARSAYDTTACQGFVLKKLQDALAKSFKTGQYRIAELAPVIEVAGQYASDLEIPGFMHPVVLDDLDHTVGARVFVDVRGYGRWNAAQNRYEVRNASEYGLILARGALTQFWVEEGVPKLRDLSSLPLAVYAEFLSRSLSKRYALDKREELDLLILTAWLYLSLFTNDTHLTERERMRWVQVISRTIRYPAAEVLRVSEQLEGPIHNLNDYCALARSITQSVRLDDLNLGILFQVIVGGWYSHHREVFATAIEHPPTWIALLMAALSDRSYKATGLARHLDNIRSADKTLFMQASKALLEQYMKSEAAHGVLQSEPSL